MMKHLGLLLVALSFGLAGCTPTGTGASASNGADKAGAKTTPQTLVPKQQKKEPEEPLSVTIDKFLKQQNWPDATTLKADPTVAKYAGTWELKQTPAQLKEFKDAKSPPKSTLVLNADGTFRLTTNVAAETTWGVCVIRGDQLLLAKRGDKSEIIDKKMNVDLNQERRIPLVFNIADDGKKIIYKNFGNVWEYFKVK